MLVVFRDVPIELLLVILDCAEKRAIAETLGKPANRLNDMARSILLPGFTTARVDWVFRPDKHTVRSCFGPSRLLNLPDTSTPYMDGRSTLAPATQPGTPQPGWVGKTQK